MASSIGGSAPVRALGREEAAGEAGHRPPRPPPRRSGPCRSGRAASAGRRASTSSPSASTARDRHGRGRRRDPQRPERLAEPRRLGAGIAAAHPHGDAPGRLIEQRRSAPAAPPRATPLPGRQPRRRRPGTSCRQRRDRPRSSGASAATAIHRLGLSRLDERAKRSWANSVRRRPPRSSSLICAGLDGQHPGAFLRGVEVVEELLLGGPLVGDGRRLRVPALVVGLGPELGQPVLHGRDAGREFRRDASSGAATGSICRRNCCSTASPARRAPAAGPRVERLLGLVDVARRLAGRLGERGPSQQAEDERQAGQEARRQGSLGSGVADGSVERRQAQPRLERPDRDGAVREG